MRAGHPRRSTPVHLLAGVAICALYLLRAARRGTRPTTPPATQPQDVFAHVGSAGALVHATPAKTRHSRRFFVSVALLSLLFLALGVRALLASRPDVPSSPAAQGGMVVLTSAKGLAVDASMTVNTRGGSHGDVTTFELSLDFQATTRAMRRRLLAQTTDGFLFEKPFRYAVLFTGGNRLADSVTAERNTGAKGPRVTCNECRDPSTQVQLNRVIQQGANRAHGVPTVSELPTLGYEFSWRAPPLVMTSSEPQPSSRFSPAVSDAEVGRAYGYEADGGQVLTGTTTTGRLHITGMLATNPFARADGREQGSLVTVPDRFPRRVVLAADAADGTYLELAAPAKARFRLKLVPERLYAVHVGSNRLRLAKRPFDRLDFASPNASATDAAVIWRLSARGAPFYWQLSSDSEITAASGRATGAGLVAGVFLGLAATLLVVLIETLVSEWRTGVTLRRSRRLLASLLAIAATLVVLVTTGDMKYTVTTGGITASFVCVGPLSAPPGSADPGGDPSLCARERDSNARAARIAGELALVLWLYLAWTRRRAGRWRLTSIAKSVLAVAAAAWAALLITYEAIWATGWSSAWLAVPLLVAPLAAAFVAIRRLRHLTAQNSTWPARWLGGGIAAVLTSLAWLSPSPQGFRAVAVILAFEICRQWALGTRWISRKRLVGGALERERREGSRPPPRQATGRSAPRSPPTAVQHNGGQAPPRTLSTGLRRRSDR
jgi:hypothetical protein